VNPSIDLELAGQGLMASTMKCIIFVMMLVASVNFKLFMNPTDN
jgi:hypothetical protein